MDFGERLISLREHANMSRGELAAKLGIPYTTLRNYETGVREPGHSFLIQVSQLFNISVDYLLGLEKNDPAPIEDAPITLGDIVKKYREENNLSMDEFSEKSGLSKGYISMLEKNKNPKNGEKIIPSIETIKKVSFAMGESFNSVLSKLDSEQEKSMLTTDTDNEPLDICKEALIQHYNKLNSVGQQEAVKRVEELTFITKYKKHLKSLESNDSQYIELKLAGRNGKKTVRINKEEARKALDEDNKNRKPIPPGTF